VAVDVADDLLTVVKSPVGGNPHHLGNHPPPGQRHDRQLGNVRLELSAVVTGTGPLCFSAVQARLGRFLCRPMLPGTSAFVSNL
jgi:hypothetical protein